MTIRGRAATAVAGRVSAAGGAAGADEAGCEAGSPELQAPSSAASNAHADHPAARDDRRQVIRYSTVMHRTSIRHGFQLLAGPVAEFVRKEASSAALAAKGLWRSDPAVWSIDRDVQDAIMRRLGWLDSPALMQASLDRILGAAREVRDAGFTDAVLLGMGGSSLAPEVLRAVVGEQAGWLRLHMLDTTDPDTVRAVGTTPSRTIYILASKSGTTIEPNSLAAYFQRVLQDCGIENWAQQFIAITDDDTALSHRAKAEGFRHIFLNPFDIGGRYSALSFFGLVPAALMGQDVPALLRWGIAMLDEAQNEDLDVRVNPAVGLGLLMGASARAKRNKLTLLLPDHLERFGLWVEQLVAESTGKKGVGIVPIAGEPIGDAHVYAEDRLFVRLRRPDAPHGRDQEVQDLGREPIATIDFPEPAAIAAEFVRWEIATAVAGSLIGINPFDEPNVQQAKDATKVLLDRYKTDHRLPAAAHETTATGVTRTLTASARQALHGKGPEAFLTSLGAGDYLGVLAYLPPGEEFDEVLQRFRLAIRDLTRVATMSGYGPRYLHSTGQLHKGGPNTGVFVLITAAARDDVPIPGQPFSFGILEHAQALGDFASLGDTHRRALHLHLPARDPRILNDALTELLVPLSRRL
jgi:glucose-6-phosphate isomerase